MNIKKTWKEKKVIILISSFTIFIIILSFKYNALIPIVSIIGTLAGTYFGYILNETSTKKKEEKDEMRQRESVRSLLSLEIDQNLKSLEELWNRVNYIKPDDNLSDWYLRIDLSRQLINLPMPNWKHIMWEDQTSLLAISLDNQEITKLYDIHASLEDLKLIYDKLLNLRGIEIEQKKDPASFMHPNTAFEKDAPKFWTDFKKITLKLLKNGNPL